MVAVFSIGAVIIGGLMLFVLAVRGCLKIGIVSSAFICYTSAVFHSGAEL